MFANQPQLTVDSHSFNHGIEVLGAALLSLLQDSNFTIELYDLLVLLITICMKIRVVDVKDFDGHDLSAGDLSTVDRVSLLESTT